MKRISPYLRMRVLGAIDYAEGKSIIQRIKHVSSLTFTDEDGHPHQFTWRTIQTWYSRYKKYGITDMLPGTRTDKGSFRKTTPEELLEAINQVLPLFRSKGSYNKRDIYRLLIEKGLVSPSSLAQTTFYRFIREHDLLSTHDTTQNKRRLAFAMQYANELWQADTMYGPYVSTSEGTKTQTKLIAFLDDASRVLTHGQFFVNETVDTLITAIRSAFYKRGVPQMLYVDNGSIYTSKEIMLICSRLGIILRHAPVRDGAAKGKIERFFRRVRDQFLSRSLDLSSLAHLNKQFTMWTEEHYNASVHSAIGMKPIDRFSLDLKRIHFLPPDQDNDELFFNEETRKVKKDNTFPFKNQRFEVPSDLRDKQIIIRYSRSNPMQKVVVYYKDTRIGIAQKLNLIANAHLPRTGGHA